jgi:hypothetical protein
MRAIATAILTFLACGSIQATALPPIVERAFTIMEGTSIDDWTYTVTSRDSEGLLVERHVATKPPHSRWQLLSKDGSTPTAADMQWYEKIRQRREKERVERERRPENVLASMIEPGSLVLVSETADRATYHFRMNGSHAKAGRFAEQLRGVMRVDKTVPYADLVELRSISDFSAAAGVRIADFEMALRFAIHDQTGAIVPVSIRTRIDGRAFLVRKIDEDSHVVFSDFVASDRIRARSRDTGSEALANASTSE